MTNTQPDSGNPWDPNSITNPFNPNNPVSPFNTTDGLLNPISPNAQGNPLSGILAPLQGATGFFNMLGRPDFWIRAGIVIAGVGLVIVGIIVLVSSSKTVGAALTAAGKAAKLTPVGAATSVAAEAIA